MPIGLPSPSIETVKLGLNDVLIVRVPNNSKRSDCQILFGRLEKAFPDHADLGKILLLEKSIKLDVIKTESIDDILLNNKESKSKTIDDGPR